MLQIQDVVSGSIAGRKNPSVVFAIDEKQTRQAAAQSNIQDIEAAIILIGNPNPTIRKIGEGILLKYGEEAIPYLIGVLNNSNLSNDSIVGVMEILAGMGPKAALELCSTLDKLTLEKNENYARRIITTLGFIGKDARGSAESIRRMLYDKTASAKPTYTDFIINLLKALERIGGKEEIEVSSWYARTDNAYEGLRVYAVKALENIALKQLLALEKQEKN